LDLVVAAEAVVAGRAAVLAPVGALAVRLAVGPAEALVVGWAMVLAPVMVAVVAAEALRRCTPTKRTRTLLTTVVMVVRRGSRARASGGCTGTGHGVRSSGWVC
jgi:hypothetical protein